MLTQLIQILFLQLPMKISLIKFLKPLSLTSSNFYLIKIKHRFNNIVHSRQTHIGGELSVEGCRGATMICKHGMIKVEYS